LRDAIGRYKAKTESLSSFGVLEFCQRAFGLAVQLYVCLHSDVLTPPRDLHDAFSVV
jgi:hypothetical protein